MQVLATDPLVDCPKEQKKISVKDSCEAAQACPYFKHFVTRGFHVYVICTFRAQARPVGEMEEVRDPELDQMEEESTEE